MPATCQFHETNFLKIYFMKQNIILPLMAVLFITISQNSFAQGFSGARNGKQTGISGVFYNPANIATDNKKWEINIGAGTAGIAFNGMEGTDSVLNRGIKGNVINRYVQSQFKINAAANADLFGPGVRYSFAPGQAVALTTRFRAMGNIHEMGGTISINEGDSIGSFSGLPTQKMSLNAWGELGVSYAATIVNTPKHLFTAGITAKYLYGGVNKYIFAKNLKVEAFGGQNSYLTSTLGRVSIGSSIDDEHKKRGRGWGVDIGFVYEKRNEKKDAHSTPYKYRVSVSVLDVGAIQYSANDTSYGDYNIHIPSGSKFMLNELYNKNGAEIKRHLDAHPAYFTNNEIGRSKYSVSLPASALVSVDVPLNKSLFVEATASLNLVDKNDQYNSFSANYISLTPRFEYKKLAVYTPVTYHAISGVNAGLSVKLGSFYIGSNSLFTMVKENQNKGQFDIHAGISVKL
jgi:Family of unknown function (DUF5723)